MAEKVFAEGIYFNKKRDGAPDFVIGSISLHPERFIEWLKGQKKDDKGYVRLSVLEGRDGKPYIQLDTWKPIDKQAEPQTTPNRTLDKPKVDYPKGPVDDIPF